MNTVYRRKIKNRKKATGSVWLIEAHTQNIPYLLIVATQQKTRQKHLKRPLMRVKARKVHINDE